MEYSMETLYSLAAKLHSLLNLTRVFDFLAPLALRLYLAPIFWMAGTKKLAKDDEGNYLLKADQSIVDWFGNTEWGLGMPFPEFMATAATMTEVFGGIFLLIGFAVRWISIPLMVTMVVAAVTVHMQNGWLAIAEATGPFASERTVGAVDRLDRAKSILKENANYDWLTENGSFVVLNNGIEFATTYFIMLLALFFIGPGKASIDYFFHKKISHYK